MPSLPSSKSTSCRRASAGLSAYVQLVVAYLSGFFCYKDARLECFDCILFGALQSLFVLAVWVWLAVDQPSNGFAGTVMLLHSRHSDSLRTFASVCLFGCCAVSAPAHFATPTDCLQMWLPRQWRRPYLVSIGQQILLFTLFREWVLDSKSCNRARIADLLLLVPRSCVKD